MANFKLKRKERKAKNEDLSEGEKREEKYKTTKIKINFKKKRTPAKETKLKMTMEETLQQRGRKLLCRNAINNRHQKRGHHKPDEK